jgi:hypothetical protein
MPNYTAIVADDLKAAGHGAIVDRARTMAVGETDPVDAEIANAVARVRRAVSAANVLDIDTTKVPMSLKGLVVRMVLFALMERIGLPLTEDQRDSRKFDQSDLNRLTDRKIIVEAPDDPETTPSGPSRGMWNSENKLIMRTHPVPKPRTQFDPQTDAYANPAAPDDAARE